VAQLGGVDIAGVGRGGQGTGGASEKLDGRLGYKYGVKEISQICNRRRGRLRSLQMHQASPPDPRPVQEILFEGTIWPEHRHAALVLANERCKVFSGLLRFVHMSCRLFFPRSICMGMHAWRVHDGVIFVRTGHSGLGQEAQGFKIVLDLK
jgi:hypothetical protein